MTAPGGFDLDFPAPWEPGLDSPDYSNSGVILKGPLEEVHIPKYPTINGYEGVSFKDEKLMEPPPTPGLIGEPPDMAFDQEVSQLDEATCRDAMLQHVSEHWCYGGRPAKKMKIDKFDGFTALHYILETFTEERMARIKFKSYRGGPLDGPENGNPPYAWSIPCDPDHLFESHEKSVEVPHTSVIEPCGHCRAKGWLWCWRCGGNAHIKCTKCKGSGRVRVYHTHNKKSTTEMCRKCMGAGRIRCTCSLDGRIICTCCKGYRMLRCFILITVIFTNHSEDYIHETTDMPDDLVTTVEGKTVYTDIQTMVWPIISFPVNEINEHSKRLVESHSCEWPSEKIRNQRQTIRGVPVTEVMYEWNNQQKRFWVYGIEHKVYSPDYPHKCCWGCTIL